VGVVTQERATGIGQRRANYATSRLWPDRPRGWGKRALVGKLDTIGNSKLFYGKDGPTDLFDLVLGLLIGPAATLI
jgi:hypothetical protein